MSFILQDKKKSILIYQKNYYNDKTTFQVIFNFKSIKILLKSNFFKKKLISLVFGRDGQPYVGRLNGQIWRKEAKFSHRQASPNS